MSAALSILMVVNVAALDSPHFYARERARAFLTSTMPLGLPYLESQLQSKSVHLESSCRRIAEKWYDSTAQERAAVLLPDNYPCLPWIDSLPENFPHRKETINEYLNQAIAVVGNDGFPNWKEHRLATRYFFIERLRWRRANDSDRKLLNQMRDREIAWIRENGKRYSPPIEVPK